MEKSIQIIRPVKMKFTPEMFYLEAFHKFLIEADGKINDENKLLDDGTERGMWLRIAWWFLTVNTTFYLNPERVLSKCLITLGQGRADQNILGLKATLALIYSFMKDKDKQTTIFFREDGDNANNERLIRFPAQLKNKIPTIL